MRSLAAKRAGVSFSRLSPRSRNLCLLMAAGGLPLLSWWVVGGESAQSAGQRQVAGASSAMELVRSSVTASADPSLEAIQTSEQALKWSLSLLLDAHSRLSRHADYTATFEKQEEIGGVLMEPETFDLTIRHEPFSVLMVRRSDGREVSYVEGRNEDKLLVSLGGWKRALGRIKIDKESPAARRESRHAITDLGLLRLTEELIASRKRDLAQSGRVRCKVELDEPWSGCSCYRFTFEYDDPAAHPVYRKSVFWIDRETRLPIAIRNMRWPDGESEPVPGDPTELDQATLIEFYAYRNLRFDQQVTDAAFVQNRRTRKAGS